jgi:drug/metabolite transporter (DMT)-like permease
LSPADRLDANRTTTPAVWAALITVYILWGSTYLAIREAIDTIPPFFMASVRFLIAGGLLYLFAARRGDRVADRPRWPQWKAAIIVGGLLLFGGNGGVSWSEQYIPSGITALLIATIPLWMVIIGRVWFKERFGTREALGVAIGFGGIVLLVLGTGSGSGNGSGHLNLAGVFGCLVAASCWAIGSLYSRKAPLPARPLVSTAMQMLTGGVILAVAGVVTGEIGRVHVDQITLRSVLGVAYLIVFGSLVAFSAYVWLLRNARLSLVATYPYVNPVVAVFLGWAFLSEPVTLTTMLAGAVIVVAVALIVSAQRPAHGSHGKLAAEELPAEAPPGPEPVVLDADAADGEPPRRIGGRTPDAEDAPDDDAA